jgi:hypothetical protein
MVNACSYLLGAPPPESDKADLKIWKNMSEAFGECLII